MTLSGNQKRQMKSAARLFAVQALFQMEASNQTVDQIMVEFEDHRFGEEFDDYCDGRRRQPPVSQACR